MRFLVFGAGAIGTYLGGSLLLQQHEVVFLEREQEAHLLRQQGLLLQIREKTHHFSHLSVVASLDEVLQKGLFDAALFALKAYDTAAALEAMRPYADHLPPLVCFQNGVENEAVIAQVLGIEKVIPATVTSAVGRRGIGNIILEKERGIGIAVTHPLAPQLAEAFRTCGIRTQLFANPAAMKWSKLLTNLVANASSAIYNLTPQQIFAHRETYTLEVKQLHEALQVMAAQGIPVVNLPHTPVKIMAWLMTRLPMFLSQPLAVQFIGRGRGNKMPSLHIDLYNKRQNSEVTILNGAVIRFGERYGVPTPVNRFLHDTLIALIQGKLPLNTYWRNPAPNT